MKFQSLASVVIAFTWSFVGISNAQESDLPYETYCDYRCGVPAMADALYAGRGSSTGSCADYADAKKDGDKDPCFDPGSTEGANSGKAWAIRECRYQVARAFERFASDCEETPASDFHTADNGRQAEIEATCKATYSYNDPQLGGGWNASSDSYENCCCGCVGSFYGLRPRGDTWFPGEKDSSPPGSAQDVIPACVDINGCFGYIDKRIEERHEEYDEEIWDPIEDVDDEWLEELLGVDADLQSDANTSSEYGPNP